MDVQRVIAGARCAVLLVALSGTVACQRDQVAAIEALHAARTAPAERAALEAIWRVARERGAPLTLTVRDRGDALVPVSDQRWWSRADHVVIGLGDRQIEHRVVQGDNLLVLLNE
ncbi:MAG: hypothetical protein IT383_04520 [Deltaproteobacteria bacterium]|nr:hypothetical protein [Deltaproteobacteria bacterium]